MSTQVTRDEAKALIRTAHFNIDDPNKAGVQAVDTIFSSFDKELAALQQQVAYWKLSFYKQCKATRRSND